MESSTLGTLWKKTQRQEARSPKRLTITGILRNTYWNDPGGLGCSSVVQYLPGMHDCGFDPQHSERNNGNHCTPSRMGAVRGENIKGEEDVCREVDVFLTVIVVMLSKICTHVKTYQITHFKHVCINSTQ